MRQIVLDTETTGVNKIGVPYKGHKIIEIGAVEIINRRLTGNNFHIYLKPNRLVDLEAFDIHGIADEFLFNQPTFSEIANEFLKYIHGAELIIHNAFFDISFIDYEFSMLNQNIPKINTLCKITDTLLIARKIFPGKRNNLDALCSRYNIDNSNRILHGALLDAQILANIYLLMTGGQKSIIFNTAIKYQQKKNNFIFQPIAHRTNKLHVILANDKELTAHELSLDLVQRTSGRCLWRERNNK